MNATCRIRFGLALPLLMLVGAATHADVDDEAFRGLVLPSKQVVLKAPLEGILKSVDVEESDRVSEGQKLAQMDDALQAITVEAARLEAQSEAEITRTRLLLEEMQIKLDRITDLAKEGRAQEWEVREHRVRLGQAQAEHEKAQEDKVLAATRLQREEETLTRYRLLAPFDGQVVRIGVEPGATLAREDSVLVMAALDELEAELYLPVELFGQLTIGKAYNLNAGTPVNAVLTGHLKTVSPTIDSASGTFRCVFTIDNPPGQGPDGSTRQMPSGFNVQLIWPQ